MSLLDRIVPASALRWGRLTADPCICFNAPFHFHACERQRPDPAALWGEHDRRAEDR